MHIRKADDIIKKIDKVKEKSTYDSNIMSSSPAKAPAICFGAGGSDDWGAASTSTV
jgi:hypothetical protein